MWYSIQNGAQGNNGPGFTSEPVCTSFMCMWPVDGTPWVQAIKDHNEKSDIDICTSQQLISKQLAEGQTSEASLDVSHARGPRDDGKVDPGIDGLMAPTLGPRS